ncbi:LodA/GoxA family CTQ-dependent oxidase [Chenggangzhangella methanolivorans]|uniref:LodA/GoxA family CTQ-dependent oxidase n=1 Tax=Chenggangzhangella methanolivorans TaxID=1437009 RepID=A0A9E6R8L8_9HYPH|nr:LodA/GoxA family CTQ-dependent oxidase [Chenggangzhangella methanolivorans]QZN98838.1 LodA/GoxA family CTQ-dependent oxidase [Chenggangzhangella methanolivorans]
MSETIKTIRIHPGIGIARLGNSDEFFVGPEAPGLVVDPGGKGGPGPNGGSYRDADARLKRQAQRYRVYGYDADGKVVAELTKQSDLVQSLRWRVHVRNMKAANYAFQGAYLFDPDKLRNPSVQPGKKPIERDKLIIDPGVHTISSGEAGPVVMKGDVFVDVEKSKLPGELRFVGFTPKDPSQEVEVTYEAARDIELGQLRLDDGDRLLFVPAGGKGECVTTPKVALSNPSETHSPPNGPDGGRNPLTNQFAYFNVPGWWDDTCGGEIDVTVTLKDGTVLSTRDGVTSAADEGARNARAGAWIVTAPPKFSPYMLHVVSILDRVYEAFPEAYPHASRKTNFYRDVYPVFAKAVNYGWVSAEAAGVKPETKDAAHGPRQPGNLLNDRYMAAFTDPTEKSRSMRQMIYNLMRRAPGKRGRLVDSLQPPPPQRPTTWKDEEFKREEEDYKMPKLWGTGGKPAQNEETGFDLPDQFLSLTDWQLNHLKEWADGNFEVGEPVRPVALDELPLADQPHALDASALEPTIGGGFHPGIEFPYLILYRENFAEAFRVAGGVEPGSVAAYMSSPWQGDFWSCDTAWWPTQRPDVVFEYDRATQTRTYKEWFRGYDESGEPLSSDDGYQQMAYAWPKLGMVLPLRTEDGGFLKDNGQMVFVEHERDPALNRPPQAKSPPAK